MHFRLTRAGDAKPHLTRPPDHRFAAAILNRSPRAAPTPCQTACLRFPASKCGACCRPAALDCASPLTYRSIPTREPASSSLSPSPCTSLHSDSPIQNAQNDCYLCAPPRIRDNILLCARERTRRRLIRSALCRLNWRGC
jgi:hypothetical protein